MIFQKAWISEQPSILAASSSSEGREPKNPVRRKTEKGC